jgi:ubiquinone biosynthesis protein
MDIIKTGIGVRKTIRNVGRLKEIVLIFAKHGFDEFFTGNLTSILPNFVIPKSSKSISQEWRDGEDKDWQGILGYRLRLCFEELGPAFIKFGQLLSSREDIFDESFINQMKMLRDKVKSVHFNDVKKSVEDSLSLPINDIFTHIDPDPIGTASIGVVYAGTLRSGEQVVLKVKRPDIEKMMDTDFSILNFLCLQAEKVSEEARYIGVSRIVKDFSSSLITEMNFDVESLNCKRFKQSIEQHEAGGLLYVPKVYDEYSSRDLLVMERLEGIPFSDQERIASFIPELGPKLEEGYRTFIKTFLQDGFFHADLHGGNFFLLEDGRIGLIDFGLMGSLSKKSRKNFIALIYSLLTFNYENVVYEFLDVADYSTIPDIDMLITDVRDGLSPYIGLTAQQIDFSIVLKVVISTLRKHEIFLPREWFIVFRALMTLDGVGRSIGKDFDIYSMMEQDIHELIKDGFSKEDILEEGIWTARDLISISRIIPKHLKWFLKDWSKKKYAFDFVLSGYEESFNKLHNSIVFLGFAAISCVFLFSGVEFLGVDVGKIHMRDIPRISWIFWSLSFATFLMGYRGLKK